MILFDFLKIFWFDKDFLPIHTFLTPEIYKNRLKSGSF